MTFSGKALAPFLTIENPDRGSACQSTANLFFEMRNSRMEFNAAGHVLEPLLRLLPADARAAEPLATMAHVLTKGCAYPEALRCIDAVIGLASAVPLGHTVRHGEPWTYQSNEPMTWPRERALLLLKRGECLLALGDEAGGEASLADGIAAAEAARMPPYFLLSASMYDHGTTADFRWIALTRAARAQRLAFEGRDASPYRKVKKRKAGTTPDPALLTRARRYLDTALVVIGPRVVEQYAGLVPEAQYEHPALTRLHKDYAWQRETYFESALVHEHVGDLDTARIHLGRAKWIAALQDPTHTYEPELREAVARLGAVDTPLA